MQRQCAWCLRLMNSAGERISSLPVPKIYDATHGMCKECGALWLQEAQTETQRETDKQPVLSAVANTTDITYYC